MKKKRTEKDAHKVEEAKAALMDEIVKDDEKPFSEYIESLELLYGKETLHECVDLVQGNTQFHGLHFPGLTLEGFSTHQALLDGYKKLHKAKASKR